MPGFFSLMKAVNKCTDELLTVGKDYAIRFKSGDINAREYENDMVGKIYEITNKYSNGDEDLEKYLRNQFADKAVDFLKEGIEAYEESVKGAEAAVDDISLDDDFEGEEEFNEEESEEEFLNEELEDIEEKNVSSSVIKPSDMNSFFK